MKYTALVSLGIVAFVFGLASVARADSNDPRLSQQLVDSIQWKLSSLEQQFNWGGCKDVTDRIAANPTTENAESSGLGDFATVADAIEQSEKKADPEAWSQASSQASYLLLQLKDAIFRGDYYPSREEDRKPLVLRLESDWDSLRSRDIEDKDIAEMQVKVLDQVFKWKKSLAEIKKALDDSKFPLSLKGPLETSFEDVSRLVSAIEDTAKASFKQKGKPVSTIAGYSDRLYFLTKVESLQNELEAGIKSYQKKAQDSYDEQSKAKRAADKRTECPKMGQQVRKYYKLLQNPSAELLAADAKVHQASAVTKQAETARASAQADLDALIDKPTAQRAK